MDAIVDYTVVKPLDQFGIYLDLTVAGRAR